MVMDNVKAQRLRNLAFGKLREDRSMFSIEEKLKIELILYRTYEGYTNDWRAVVSQIYKDIQVYKKYDCLAMWLDWECGLVRRKPDLIEKIAKEVGGLEADGIDKSIFRKI